MLILLDTNVLLRTVEPGHAHHTAAAEAPRKLKIAGHELCVVPQIFYEFWVVATRPTQNNGLGMSGADAQAEISRMTNIFTLLRDERAIFERWEALVGQYDVKGRQAHDTRIVAAMLRHGMTHILTFDQSDFARYTEITAHNPTAVVDGELTL